MASSVSTILNSAMGDGARSTHYRIIAAVPGPVTKSAPGPSLEDINVLAKTVSIPTIENAPIIVSVQGHPVPLPAKSNYQQSLSITFYADDKHQLRTMFSTWEKILDPSIPKNEKGAASALSIGGFDLGSVNPFGSLLPTTGDASEGLSATLKVQLMDFEEELVNAEYEFHGLFPVAVEGVTFDGSATSQIQEFNVTFNYQSYEVTTGTGLLDGVSSIVDKGMDMAMDAIGDVMSGGFDAGKDSIMGGAPETGADSNTPGSKASGDVFNRIGLAK